MKTITVSKMAEELGVSERKVYQMLRDNQIPNIRAGALYIVSRAAWDQWLASLGVEKVAVLQ